MKRLRTMILALPIATVLAIATGCASSEPASSEGPPETPEISPPATTPDDRASQSDSEVGGGGSGFGGTDGRSGSNATGANTGDSADGTTEDTGGTGDGVGVSSRPGEAPPPGSAATADESAALLDAELAASAGKFDAEMLEELRRLAAEGSGRTGDEGAPASQAGSGASAGRGADASDEGGEDDSAGVGGPNSEASGAEAVPPDVGDGSDDDIVARQLREAAMEENDPELREKLWDEYRRYKASVSESSKDDS